MIRNSIKHSSLTHFLKPYTTRNVSLFRTSQILPRMHAIYDSNSATAFTLNRFPHSVSQVSNRSYGSSIPGIRDIATMSEQEKRSVIIDILMALLRAHEKVDESKVTPSCHFMKDLGIDSLDLAEIVFVIEETFRVQVDDEDSWELQSMSSCVEYLMKNPFTQLPPDTKTFFEKAEIKGF